MLFLVVVSCNHSLRRKHKDDSEVHVQRRFVKTYNVAIRGPVHEIPFDCDVSVVAGERSCR